MTAIDLYLAYSIIKKLTTPFKQWPAYKLGIIDSNGNELRKMKDLNTVEERSAFGIFDRIILRLKKILSKLPAGQTKLGTYAAALWLIKEEANGRTKDWIFVSEEAFDEAWGKQFNFIIENMDVNKYFDLLEDAPANSSGGGGIDGIGVGPKGEAGMPKAKQDRLRKMQNTMIKRFGTY